MMAAVPVARETKSARTRRCILDAAADLFSEQGYGARLSDIAGRAGMKAGPTARTAGIRRGLARPVRRCTARRGGDADNDVFLPPMPALGAVKWTGGGVGK